jgi:hypothetical protein
MNFEIPLKIQVSGVRAKGETGVNQGRWQLVKNWQCMA